jgi:hypothetical protein
LLLLAVGFSAQPCAAAPAPFPRTHESAAEVVFDAATAERARLIAAYLRSWGFSQALANSPAVTEHLRQLNTMQQRRDWFRDRLRVTHEGNLIRVRLEHRSAPLVPLRLLTGQLVSPPEEPDDGPQAKAVRVLLAAIRRRDLAELQERMQRSADKATAEEMEVLASQAGRYEVEAEPLKLHAAPRSVGR